MPGVPFRASVRKACVPCGHDKEPRDGMDEGCAKTLDGRNGALARL